MLVNQGIQFSIFDSNPKIERTGLLYFLRSYSTEQKKESLRAFSATASVQLATSDRERYKIKRCDSNSLSVCVSLGPALKEGICGILPEPALLVTRSMQHGAADVIVNSLPFPNLNTFFNTHMILPHLDLPVPRIV